MFDPKILSQFNIVDYGYTTEEIPKSLDHYNDWVDKNEHLPLSYLEGERQTKRQSLKTHWPEFQSALVFLFSYHQAHTDLKKIYKDDPNWNGLKLASYSVGFEGLDYHHLIKERLISIGELLKAENPGLDYKLTLDTHPVLERDLAMRSGIGWFGKNSMLINRNHGSFFIIGSLLLNQTLELAESKPLETDHCGQCTRCIDACPTKAIDPVTRTIIAKDCISTFTIEQFKLDTIPSEKMSLQSGFIFGCDICQDVCPWNERIDRNNQSISMESTQGQKKIINFFLKTDIPTIEKNLSAMSEGIFKKEFSNTSFERSGKRGLLKNIRFYLKERL